MNFWQWLKQLFTKKYKWPNGIPDLNKWLKKNRKIRSKIVWNSFPYVSWSSNLKTKLFDYYVKLYRNEPLSMVDPPANQFSIGDNKTAAQHLSEEDTQKLYLAYVANSLVIETKNVLPWSLKNLDSKGLRIMLDSNQMFSKRRIIKEKPVQYYVDRKTSGRVISAPPDITFKFMSDKIGSTRKETIKNLLSWCKKLSHFSGKFVGKNMEDHWQYRGFPPVSRIISGTVNPNKSGLKHYTAGCHGTTGFLRAVLRSVNIPVEYRITDAKCAHAHPCFISENLSLSHGDDPYNRNFKNSDKPIEYLFITEETFVQWYRTGSFEYRCKNVGRKVKELAD